MDSVESRKEHIVNLIDHKLVFAAAHWLVGSQDQEGMKVGFGYDLLNGNPPSPLQCKVPSLLSHKRKVSWLLPVFENRRSEDTA